MSSQRQVKSNLHAMTYLFNSSNALFMITNSWAQFMSKDVPIYVHHIRPRFGQEIINNLLSPVCHVYSLTVIQESKFMREYVWYFGYYFAKNICLESLSILHQNCSKNIPLSNRTGKNTMPTRELTQNNT